MTSAVISLALVLFFSVVFINTFISMIHKENIVSNTVIIDNPDPTLYNITTSDFMFATSVN